MAWKESNRRTWARFGPNARDWPSRSAWLKSMRLLGSRSVETHGQIPADLGVKGSQVQILSARPMKVVVRGHFSESP